MLHSAPRGSLCAEAFRVIEADLEAFSPGRAAAHDGHGRLAKANELLLNVHDHVHMTHATSLVRTGRMDKTMKAPKREILIKR